MTVTRTDIVARARTWLGTPFHHQGRLKGVGCDCAGLLVGVGRELGLPVIDLSGYPRQPDGHGLKAHLDATAVPVPIAAAGPGDVLLFRIGRHPCHLALLTERDTIIHAYADAGAVVETRLGERWRRRLLAAYRFPGNVEETAWRPWS